MSAYDSRQWRALAQVARRQYPPICHLCGIDIDQTLPTNDPGAYTVDHLDPVADHGTTCPTIDRVRPAHRGCNAARGARDTLVSTRRPATLSEQLRLEGRTPRSEQWGGDASERYEGNGVWSVLYCKCSQHR